MRKRLAVSVIFGVALLALLNAAPASASMDYYTYGGFDPVTVAFNNIARIFGDNSYKGALLCFGMLGIFFGAAAAFLKIASGMSSNGFSWVIPIVTGMMVYAALFTRTDTLYVYDPVYNQNTAIGGLPVGIVYSAGVLNTLERFIINVFDTNAALPPATACGSMPQLNYQDQGGAVGLRALQASLTEYVQNNQASSTLIKFVDDCVEFELVRPGSTLTEDQLLDPGCDKNFLDVLSAGQSDANYTTSYFINPPAGTVQTCTQVYNQLSTFYNSQANSNQAVNNACGGTGFEDMSRCQQLIGDMLQSTIGSSLTAGGFVSNNTVANITSQTLLTAGGPTQAQYLTMLNQAQSGTSTGFIAGIMNPYMIDGYVAYSILLFPILAMFLPTPMWKKAFTLMLSLIMWTTLLRSLDVITFHMWVIQYQKAAAAALNNIGMGIDAAMRLPMFANKYLGNFATMRNSVFLLATSISGVLFGFGDSALSRLADRASASNADTTEKINDRGVAGESALSAERNASRAAMLTTLAGGTYMSSMGAGLAAEELDRAATGMGKMDTYGGSATSMMDGQRHVAGVQTSQHTGYASGMSLSDSFSKGVNEAGSVQGAMEKLGRDGQMSRHLASVMTDKNIGDSRGFEQSLQVAQNMGFKGGRQEFQQMMSEVGNLKNFSDAQGFHNVADKYFGGDEAKAGQALVDIAAFQGAKHIGEINQIKAGTGEDAPGGGMALGKASGDNDLSLMASDNVRRILADNAGYKGETGYYQFMHDQAGANLSAFTDARRGYGPVKHSVATDGHGNTIAQQEQGSVKDKQHMAALERELKTAGFKNAAAGVHSETKKGHGFDFTITRDGEGHITGFQANGGAATFSRDFRQTLTGRQDDYKELTTRTTGTDNQDIDRKVHIVDQGLRSTIGNQAWRGERIIDEHTRISTISDYAQVDRTFTKADDVSKANEMFVASGSSVRVALGDSVQMRVGPSVAQNQGPGGTLSSHGPQGYVSTISSFSVKRGGDKEFKDFTDEVRGTHKTTYDNKTDRHMGVNVDGAGSDVIRAVAGEKATEVIMGTTNATVAGIQNASAIKGVGKLIKSESGKVSTTPTIPSGHSTRPPSGIVRY